jgi:hypothetical protein
VSVINCKPCYISFKDKNLHKCSVPLRFGYYCVARFVGTHNSIDDFDCWIALGNVSFALQMKIINNVISSLNNRVEMEKL